MVEHGMRVVGAGDDFQCQNVAVKHLADGRAVVLVCHGEEVFFFLLNLCYWQMKVESRLGECYWFDKLLWIGK